MRLQVLVSTLKQGNNSDLVKRMNINSDAIVINQCEIDSANFYEENKCKIEWYNSSERGLSKSRNMALNKATGDICIFADDDLIYVDNMEQLVINEFKKEPNVDIIVFQVEGINRKFKKYYHSERYLGYISALKVSSVEIAFRLSSIKKNSIAFNEKFGAGALYEMGEENIFLYECLRNRLRIKYVPIKIADLYIGKSSWFKGYNDKYFRDLGAIYAEMSRHLSWFLIIQFAFRKYNLYKQQKTLLNAIINMFQGRKVYLRSLKNNDLGSYN